MFFSVCICTKSNSISRNLWAKKPHFQAGISARNVTMVVEELEKLDYCGPLALSWDDMDLEQSLSIWNEGNDVWMVLGGSDGPICVMSAEAVDAIFDKPELKKADKVRCHQVLTARLNIV